jgi:hypothetical protein
VGCENSLVRPVAEGFHGIAMTTPPFCFHIADIRNGVGKDGVSSRLWEKIGKNIYVDRYILL